MLARARCGATSTGSGRRAGSWRLALRATTTTGTVNAAGRARRFVASAGAGSPPPAPALGSNVDRSDWREPAAGAGLRTLRLVLVRHAESLNNIVHRCSLAPSHCHLAPLTHTLCAGHLMSQLVDSGDWFRSARHEHAKLHLTPPRPALGSVVWCSSVCSRRAMEHLPEFS